jgi:hypothetical protein
MPAGVAAGAGAPWPAARVARRRARDAARRSLGALGELIVVIIVA